MPRPASGYKNSAGLVVPGTTDITSRFANKSALIVWAYKRGRDGEDLYDTGAVNIGTVVHKMAEMDLQGWKLDDIDHYVEQTLPQYEHRATAVKCFAQFRAWKEKNHVQPIAQEVPFVSESHQYGGTPDTIALINGRRGILDFKTSKDGTVYPEMPVVMAAHGRLWNENNPDQPLDEYHLLCLPKDGKPFNHVHWTQDQIEPFWTLFAGMRDLYDLDKACSKREALEGLSAPAAPRPLAHAEAAPRRSQPSIRATTSHPKQPADRLSYQPQAPMSMAELLRAYDHVPAIA